MTELFSDEWMQKYLKEWNRDSELVDGLKKAKFSGNITYGYVDDEAPLGIIEISKGRAVYAGHYKDEKIDWDLRATKESWTKWLSHGLGMMALGMAYTSRKMHFRKGDYKAMVKSPTLAKPFVRSFNVMGNVKID